jgi:hypothetical protein
MKDEIGNLFREFTQKTNVGPYKNLELEYLLREINPTPYEAYYVGCDIYDGLTYDNILLKWSDKYGFVILAPEMGNTYSMMYFEKTNDEYEMTKFFSTSVPGPYNSIRFSELELPMEKENVINYIRSVLRTELPRMC